MPVSVFLDYRWNVSFWNVTFLLNQLYTLAKINIANIL
jgi:hypothetical protein